MTEPGLQLLDWLDDLCVRFIINLPHEELTSAERICFQIEEAQWFYEDFIRPLDPTLPSMNLRIFSQRMFQHCPLFAGFSEQHHAEAYQHFLQYKTRVPVRGAIMLNDQMTHAVLVKGWKKGAKWSFPRGKINKDEPDLDCAIREVYEETGFDLNAAGLVKPESEMKKIGVDLREQNMLLYVFRGVPMDTRFEPRTRKEISKIDWYKLSDLPTQTRRNQVNQINQNNFYMVAPFLHKLKQWIKQQRKLDRLEIQASTQVRPPVAAGVTDTEELEADLGETTADEAPIPEPVHGDGNFADLVAKLGRHRASDALPEVSAQPQPEHFVDPAAELKRLLSVGTATATVPQTVEAPAPPQQPPAHPLLAMLHANNRPAPPPEAMPRTPFEQILPPQQPHSPHGQHHPRPPHLDHMPPPPPFPFHNPHGPPYPGPHNPHISPPQHNGAPPPISRQFLPPPPQLPHPVFPSHAPSIQQAFSQHAPRPYQQTGDPQFAHPPQFPGLHGPAIPPASKLPPPKLTAHTLGLLNAFKMNEKPAISSPQALSQPQSPQGTPKTQQPPHLHRSFDPLTSPPGLHSANPYAPSPPPFRSPPPGPNFQPVQPKPRSAHQDSLLSLFRSPSVTATPPPQKTPEQPAELSAYPATPGQPRTDNIHTTSHRMPEIHIKPQLLDAFSLQQNKPGLTSATVHAPFNAPDFETMKRNAHHPMNGHSRGPSPAHQKPEPKMFVPQQILKREDTSSTVKGPSADSKASPKSTTMPAASAAIYKPQILKRPQQPSVPTSAQSEHTQGLLDLFKSPPQQPAPALAPPAKVPTPTPHASFDRRDTLPADQKTTLLSLFSKPSQSVGSPAQIARSPLVPAAVIAKSPLTSSPVPVARSPHPPTPKNVMSGVISPVSPLPANGSQTGSPANLASRSRISSIGDSVPSSVVIPQNPGPTSFPHIPTNAQKNGRTAANEEGYSSTGSGGLAELGVDKIRGKSSDGKSPVDKTFLLGFLNDFANKGR